MRLPSRITGTGKAFRRAKSYASPLDIEKTLANSGIVIVSFSVSMLVPFVKY
jgi:hypothetical protein